jgi:hypothetical protein
MVRYCEAPTHIAVDQGYRGGGTVLDYVVRRNRERYDMVDAGRDVTTGTPRVVCGRLVACEHRGGYQHQRLVRHLPLRDVAGLQRRHCADRMLRLVLDACRGAALARRSVRLPVSMERVPALMGSAPPRHPPATGAGVVTFLMGWRRRAFVSASCRVIGRTACSPTLVGVVERAIQFTNQGLAVG